ncbi:MAG: 2-oxoglutarate dehydrogenase complex dihydrolipoyllysine-residue succinyltransferase [Gemmatimonadaceae bacterium]|nr:2-oxoglutarate dehydrogenase complex dihydrolipoyllysine-residue succinyltransferase [Gemmatimonadaceae bacterium]MDQ3519530.1 2-oxoglutarate dehydrogenase complex dihydrolipoyllysine-residue succinyltransferase [Gemmatimonadota bacterium]
MISIKVPPLGESIVEATIAKWLKQPGESVAQGETLVELETDKITVEVPAFKSGVLAKHLKNEGDVVKVDEVLGEMDASAVPAGVTGEATPANAGTATQPTEAGGKKTGAGAPPKGEAKKPGAKSEQPVAAQKEAKTSPAVRRIAAEESVDVTQVAGTGRDGRVTKPDMVVHLDDRKDGSAGVASSASGGGPPPMKQSTATSLGAQHHSAAPANASTLSSGERETREKMSTRRRRIAEHLLESQHSTAHLTTFNEVDMSAVQAVRDRLKEKIEKEHEVKLTFMPFFVKAASMALKTIPVVNAQVEGDTVVYKHYVNMGVAVASDQGLVVPVIKDADRKGMLDVSRDISAIAKRAREGKLTMDDLTGGTFTITNGGVFGSLVSTPIINYPQVGILGLHKIQDRPVAQNGQVVIRPMMYIALSYDHRIVDGQQAVLFLVRVKELIEDPAAMLVE